MEMHEHADLPATLHLSQFVIGSLGLRTVVLLLFVFALALTLAAIAIARFKTTYLTAVLLAVVPLPLLYGFASATDSIIRSFAVISISDTKIQTWHIAEGGASSLVCVLIGLLVTIPLYLLAIVALSWRAFHDADTPRSPKEEPVIGATLAPRRS
ncbi:hypothetical protein [Anatilimnocola floriformis]|uniref:hypothetical protein n=1 Tax=Anatilimnocola floriformis TaxID=2948575 RepID=UPI0020C1EF32|nr:hypothetical protein [Anatilimnocola floriformis]